MLDTLRLIDSLSVRGAPLRLLVPFDLFVVFVIPVTLLWCSLISGVLAIEEHCRTA